MVESTKESEHWSAIKAGHGSDRLLLGPYCSYQFLHNPRHLLFSLSRLKFATKMIGSDKRILEVGCSEGMSTLLLAEFASECVGIDVDSDAIAIANEVLASLSPRVSFKHADILNGAVGKFDAVVSMDVIEHIFPENEKPFMEGVVANLGDKGIGIIGTPNITASQYASPLSQSGHVNLYSHERLKELLECYFETVLMFSGNDEMIHTGFAPMAHYLIGVGINPKKES
jgi:2-polyprenyl-3-methyl-5-hydroxy-6-metoxy-1,4-benzoquinol methylase